MGWISHLPVHPEVDLSSSPTSFLSRRTDGHGKLSLESVYDLHTKHVFREFKSKVPVLLVLAGS